MIHLVSHSTVGRKTRNKACLPVNVTAAGCQETGNLRAITRDGCQYDDP
jgi:hypothetical protein